MHFITLSKKCTYNHLRYRDALAILLLAYLFASIHATWYPAAASGPLVPLKKKKKMDMSNLSTLIYKFSKLNLLLRGDQI